MHIRALTQQAPAKAASLEAKLDVTNQVISTILATDNLLTTLGIKAS